jgi:hypothetical protein
MTWKYGLVLICVLFCNSSAQNNKQKAVENSAIWEPPSTIDIPGSVKAGVPREMITSLRVAGESIVLDETDLKAVQSRVGGTIGHRGDAGGSLDCLCLHGSGVQGRWASWLMSGEINGGAQSEASVGSVWNRLHSSIPDARHFQMDEGC